MPATLAKALTAVAVASPGYELDAARAAVVAYDRLARSLRKAAGGHYIDPCPGHDYRRLIGEAQRVAAAARAASLVAERGALRAASLAKREFAAVG